MIATIARIWSRPARPLIQSRIYVFNNSADLVRRKGRKYKPTQLTLPIFPELPRIIDASPCGELTFLMKDLKRPVTDAGFGNKFRQSCDEAGQHHCSADGCARPALPSRHTMARPLGNQWRSLVGLRRRRQTFTRARRIKASAPSPRCTCSKR